MMRIGSIVIAFGVACGNAPRAAAPSTVDLEARAAAFVDAYTSSSPILLSDGRVVFVSTRDGLPAIYVGDAAHPSAAPKKLPGPNDRVSGVRVLPGEQTALFVSDHDADGNFHVFRVELDGSGFTDLTPAPELHRDPPAVSREVPDLFAFSAHTMTDATTHVFVQRLGGAPRDLYSDQGSGFLRAVSPDGTHAIYERFLSDESQLVFAIDLADGVAARVYPPDGEIAAIGDAQFAPDGQSIYLSSEARGRPARVLRIDASTARELARYDETTAPNASVGGLEVSPKGDQVAIEIDAGDHLEVRVVDAQLAHPRTAELGLVSGGLGPYRADGAQLAATITRPDAPTDVFAIDSATLRLIPLRDDPRAGLDAPRPTATIDHVAAFDGKSIPVNVYLPPAASSHKLPTLVWVHGGPSGSAPIGWSYMMGFWSSMGFAVIAPNIRGSSGFGFDYMAADDAGKRGDALRDMESVNRWLRAQPWCDGDRIVIAGISYGGYMTLLALGKQPSLWRAGIDGSGMSNLKTMEQLEDQQVRVFDETEFGQLGTKDGDALLERWSPLTYVGAVTSPVFVYQGVHDPITPQGEADQIVTALQRRKIPVEYMLVENEGHGVTRRDNKIAFLVRTYRFVAAQLGL